MIVTLKDHTLNPEYTVGENAAICYDSRTDEESCLRRAENCKNQGHMATMRFAYATFNVAGISRVCSHQLVRVAHAGILQRSQRYVKETNVKFVNPPALDSMPPHLRAAWLKVQAEAESVYLQSIEFGMRKEDARYILPQACSTELNICMNFQGWRDFLKNRTDKHAQWEIRAVALEIQSHLNFIAPRLFPLCP